MRDALGQRGERIFEVLITKFHSDDGPIFKPQFLGDKWQYVDFIVELVGAVSCVPYFFVQVKTTRQGCTKNNRLNVKVEKKSVIGIASYPAPTYIVGIDEIKEVGYLVSANGENLTSLSNLSTKFPINEKNRQLLWDEVNDFWKPYIQNKQKILSSKFTDQ